MRHSIDSDHDSNRTSWLLAAFSISAACALLVGCIPNGDTPGPSASPSDLQAVELSVGALQPVFASTTASYTVLAADSAQSTFVTATTSDPSAKLVINNQPAVSGQAFGPIPLDPDLAKSTIITLVVVPPGSAQPRSYTITVARAGNADLKTLTVVPGPLTPVFSPDVLSYRVNVGNNITTVGITATAQDPSSSVTINGVAGTTSNITSLQVGENLATIRVRTVAGATQDYAVIIVRAGAPSHDSSLASLQVSAQIGGGTRELLCPGSFTRTLLNYVATPVPNGTAGVSVVAIPTSQFATLKIDKKSATAGAPQLVSLLVGNNSISIEVTAQDGSSTKYTVSVERASSFVGTDSLWALSTSVGPLTPTFCHNTYKYTASTTGDAATVTATAADPANSVWINNLKVASGTTSAPIKLVKGRNDISIQVITPNGFSSNDYTLAINRF